MDMNLKQQAMDYLSKMKPIAVSLDRLQRNNCHLADSVVIWKELQSKFEDTMSVSDWLKFEDKISCALTPAPFLAHFLYPHCHDCPHNTK